MKNKQTENKKAAAKRAAKAAASGLQVSGTTLGTAPALPAACPPPPPPALPYTGSTPPAHFTPEEVELGQDPDGTWVATAVATARVLNAFEAAQRAAAELGLLPAKAKRYVSKTDANSAYHNRQRSTAEKPVAIVHRFCAANPGMVRKDIIALCIAAGVNKNTAATQYSMFQLKNKAA